MPKECTYEVFRKDDARLLVHYGCKSITDAKCKFIQDIRQHYPDLPVYCVIQCKNVNGVTTSTKYNWHKNKLVREAL